MVVAFTKAIAIWLIIVVAAVLNGLLREQVLTPLFGTQISLPLSGITLSLIIIVITYYLIPTIGKHRSQVFMFIGLLWVALTLSFEYLFGHFVLGKSWTEINAVFSLEGGNLFVLAVICTASAPWFVAKFRGMF
jgi:hypothetical protein